ncbi:LysR family transcriptional regulator, hydrogen peroxide-inducible genes activator [Enhydrobacter aerosaccus]|uniref:LysR family transcriptional regulator, hydrogen peroxide-inducible genes activator n=1 Tax=Enhydrobacter aerosaccus TaxID=225324 RepID=A0A1T4NIP2_9HYPH|nr:LysR family transcriptional regulator, hydrogen peroxide-inducible genes activator [Enhydrobacter aerosaccus]
MIAMRPLPSFRQLSYLVAVVDLCHFGKAADACGVTQSTLSAGIRELEEVLGAPLLERTKRQVIATPLGRDMAARARELLKAAEDMVDAARSSKDTMAGPLRLGVIPTIGPFVLPHAMPRLRKAFPRLRLFLREEQTAPLLAKLRAGELDAVLLALPYAVGDDLEAIDIADDPFSAVYPPGRAEPPGKPVRPGDIAFENLLLLEDGHCLRDQALAACHLEGARRNEEFQGTSLHTLVQMVAAGLGITLLPQMAIDAGILRGTKLETRPLAGKPSSRRIGLAWRRRSARKETFRTLAAALKDELAKGRRAVPR